MRSTLALRHLRRPGLRLAPWLLACALLVQGVGQGIARIAMPSHAHRGAAAPATLAEPADAHLPSRDGHRSIPWIGVEPVPHAHAALGTPAHAHGLDDASVVVVDADGDLADTAPVIGALGLPPPGSSDEVAAPEGHAAWIGAPGWHVLGRSRAPLERPPRDAPPIA